MNTVRGLAARFLRDDTGMETVEWVVMAAIMIIGVITVAGLIGANMKATFTTLQSGTAPLP